MWRRWRPFHDLEALRREVDRVFDGYGFRMPRTWRSVFLPGSAARAYPLLNVAEDAEAVYVEALAPGIDPEKLDVSIKGDTLTISGEKKALGAVKPEQIHRSERAAGRFVRTLDLGTQIDDAKIRAEYKGGLLLITMPKSEEAKPKQITVNVK